MQLRSAPKLGAGQREATVEVEESKIRRNVAGANVRNMLWAAPRSKVIMFLLSTIILQAVLWTTWSHFTRHGSSKDKKCWLIFREYALDTAAKAEQLPPNIRTVWDQLECGAFLSAQSYFRGNGAGDGRGTAGGAAVHASTATNATAASVYDICPAPCMDSWSYGEWVQWCPPDSRRFECGYNFVLPDQKCLFHWFDRRETAQCMKNNWLMLLGSSGTMNLGMTWLMSLDPQGTAHPFHGPRWYNKTCWHNKSIPCEKGWDGTSLSFVNFATMAYDLIMDSSGAVVYKASGKFDGKEGPHISEAPAVPAGGWRLTVLPIQYAHEAVKKVEDAIRPEVWTGALPIVYVQIGQWYLNAFDGRSRMWGLFLLNEKRNTSLLPL